MKKIAFLLVLILVMMSCASNSQRLQESTGGGSMLNFSDVIGKEMKLITVFVSGGDINFKRDTLPEPLANAFTLKFDDRIAGGMAAPNRYTAPYTLGENQSITIGLMATTLMASFIEPENLNEQTFIGFMQNAYAWTIENNNLVLLCKNAEGYEVRMVYAFN